MALARKIPIYTRNEMHISFFISAIVMTMFLCYIDEGYYDFRWMTSWLNWIVFFLYVLILFVSQEFLAFIFYWVPKNAIVKSILILSGLALGIWICFRCFAA